MKVSSTLLAVGVIGIGLLFGASGRASADNLCTTIYDTSNGTTTFPGTFAGAVSGGCLQIGNLSDSAQGHALINTTDDPSIYEFQVTTDGLVTIMDKLGNNGTNADVGAQLYSLADSTSTSGTALGTALDFPFASGGTGEYTLFTDDLTSGFYAVDTYLDTDGDPRYQLNITETDSTATPEPSSLLLLGAGLLGLAIFKSRRTASQELSM
ncbi:MAG: PEP-CTERM sorting domain-containing protein [Candidatus Acidiferrales bacterium]